MTSSLQSDRRSMTRTPATAWDAAWVHDPGQVFRPLARRKHHACCTDAGAVPKGRAVMLDTNVYIYKGQGVLPTETADLVDGRTTLHSGIALAELAITAGLFDPSHPTTGRYRDPVENLLNTINLSETRAPSPAAWAEAGMLSGILARTQLGLAKPKQALSPAGRCCQESRRRKLLNDALIFLTARENGAVLVTSNLTDMDLMMRFRPDAFVYAYAPLKRPFS